MIKNIMRKFFAYITKPWNMVLLVLVLIVILLIIGSFFSFNQESFTQPPPKPIAVQTKSLIEKVGQHVFLPENEVPTIATVTDLEALKGQAFFVDARIGDKVLIFTKAKKAVLYDPKADKIVTIAPLSVTGAEHSLQY